MVTLADTFIIGDPLFPETEGGPLIHPSEIQRVHTWVQEAIQLGAILACGGKAISETLYKPTILINPPDDATVSIKEIFGPVLCIYSYNTVDEAIERANALQFGFQASVFTKNTDTAFYIMKKLNASAVMLNDHTAFRVDWMPFGGRDSSGLGWGGIPYSIKEYSREKMLVFSSPALE
jgi:acyl-CoA reductase-like NAD-dependent aldehyde dehydrogenase